MEVSCHGDRGAEPAVTLRTPGEPLLHDAIKVRGGGARHARMPGLLTGALEAMDECRQPRGGPLRGVEPLGEPMDVLLEAGDALLLLVDQRDERSFRPQLEIRDDTPSSTPR